MKGIDVVHTAQQIQPHFIYIIDKMYAIQMKMKDDCHVYWQHHRSDKHCPLLRVYHPKTICSECLTHRRSSGCETCVHSQNEKTSTTGQTSHTFLLSQEFYIIVRNMHNSHWSLDVLSLSTVGLNPVKVSSACLSLIRLKSTSL